MKHATMKLGLTSAVSALALCVGGAATAQEADGPQSGSGSGLQEIIVTAQKRSENVQSVPASISVLGGETLANRQVNDITDLASQVPSMQVATQYGANLVTIRGISTGLTSGAEDGSVAVHINGVYQARTRALDVALNDLERVEVLAGPQGTLYGRNATGGVVNYILRGPSKDFEADAKVFAGNYDRYGASASVSGPLSSAVGVRISGLYDDQRKGFTENLLVGAPTKRLEAKRTTGVRGILRLEPVDNLTIDLEGMYSKFRGSTIFAAAGPSSDPALEALLQPRTFEPHKVFSDVPAKSTVSSYQYSGTLTYDVAPTVTIKSITAYQKLDSFQGIDTDGTGYAAVPVFQTTRSHAFTQELNLTTSTFDDRLKSTFGAFYYTERITAHADVPFMLGPPPVVFIQNDALFNNTSYAAFTDQTFSVTDQLRLIGGLRYNYDKKKHVSTQSANGFQFCNSSADANWDAWTPKVGAQYDFTPNVMGYAQWSKGFKAGGFVNNTCGDKYDPESIKGFEVGLKTELLDRHLRLNVAGFSYRISNLQVQQAVGMGFEVTNAASAKIEGFELTALARVTENVTFDVAGAIQRAKYLKFLNCNGGAFAGSCTTPALTTLVDLSGNELNRAPPYTLNVGMDFNVPLAGGASILFRGETYFVGKTFYNEFQTPGMNQKAYSLQNAFVTYRSPGDTYNIRAYVKNIASTNYRVTGFISSANNPTVSWAAPRTFGIELSAKFR